MAQESGKTASSSLSSPADAYIGSHISLLSKYDIRYEGVLYFLSPQDSTLGLKNVRSYGTEGRRKDGPQIPPSDKVYEYILFRGSDIKDLQVKSSPPAQPEELIHNDPAIIQSRFAGSPSSSSKSAPVGGSLTDYGAHGDMSSLNMKSYTSLVPPHQSGSQVEPWNHQTIQNTSTSSYAMPTHWQEYSGIIGNNASQNPVQSSNQSLPTIENVFQAFPAQAFTTAPLTYPSNSAAPGPMVVTSNPVHLSVTNSLPIGQLSTSSSGLSSFSVKSSFPSHPEVLVGTRLSPSLISSSSQIRSSIEAPSTNKLGSNPVSSHPLLSSYPVSSVVDSSLRFSLNHPPRLLTPDQLSQPRVSEISSTQKLYLNQTDVGILSSSSSTASPAVQAPLLPLPPPTQKLQYSPEFAEEFDFEAMNEKFKKDEIWGYFGKAKQGDKPEGVEDNSSAGKNMGDGSLVTKVDAKPAYNKDDFFDTISRNLHSRGAGTGQNGFSQRMKMDTETFGNHQQGVHPGYAGYGAGRGPYNWRRGYHYGGRGRGRFTQT